MPTRILTVLLGVILWSVSVFAEEKTDRQFIKENILEVMASSQKETSAVSIPKLAKYLGKRAKIEVRVRDVYPDGRVLTLGRSPHRVGGVLENFTSGRERVMQLEKEALIVVGGTIETLESTFYILTDCELISEK